MNCQTPILSVLLAVICFTGLGVGCATDSVPDPDEPEPIEISLTTTVPAGGEVFRCQYMTLPPGDHDIIRFEHEYTVGSHHILLYPTSLTPSEAAARATDFDCTSIGELGQIGLAYGASEEPRGEQAYPEGVGLKLGGEQVVLLEAHYLNATDTDLEATASVRMFPSAEPVTVAAGNLFFYNYAILIPPMPATARVEMSCELPQSIELQFASSHMHRRGIHYTSSVVGPNNSERVLHETDDWESAEPASFSPSLTIEGGSRIDFACDYRNDLPMPVTEGESAQSSEMCMFIASYWPQQDEATEACAGGSSGPLLSGEATCLEVLECLGNADSSLSEQTCIASTCAEASPSLNSLIFCIEAAGCTSDACIERNCFTEFNACEASQCAS